MTTQSADHLYSKSNPYSSGLLVNRVMTEGSDKETRHFEFSLQDSGLSYEPGDSLGVLPVNCSEVVDDLLSVLGFSGTEPVQIGEESFSLKDTLLHKFACTVLSKIQIKKFNDIARVPALEELLKIENKNDLVDYMWGRELIDLFKEYPQQGLAVEDFVSLLRPMPPRLYSIASSLSAHSEEVHLTVAVVRYDSHGEKEKGFAPLILLSEWGRPFPVIFIPTKTSSYRQFKMLPLSWWDRGLELLPFGLLSKKGMATGATGKNWLFFGDRSQKTDYLYGEEWIRYQKDGILNELDLAWSRDQEEKVYVQHKMLERGAELWNWIQEGALFYVCGDASRMAKDVDQALRTIAQEHGSMSEEDSAVWIKSLQKEKRYLKDVY